MIELSDKNRIVKILYDANLQISKGDEVVIYRGIVHSENNIRASVMENINTGRKERSSIEGTLMSRNPIDIEPPIRGVVQRIDARSYETEFDLAIHGGIIEVGLENLLKEASVVHPQV